MSTNAVDTTSTQSPRRAKDIFGDCALVEIIHLHDCFRGALKNLQVDVSELCREITAAGEEDAVHNASAVGRISDLERRVAGRFTVIWSVFRAHSAAEDEFIWPALKAKQVALPNSSYNRHDSDSSMAPALPMPQQHPFGNAPNEFQGQAVAVAAAAAQGNDVAQHQRDRAHSMTVHCIEQEEYEEDHADEERMFNSINGMLSNLRDDLSNRRDLSPASGVVGNGSSLRNFAKILLEGTGNLMRHLMTHLDKEETHCMPLVAQYLTKAEINDLVGKIMGKRSSELMSQILTMAVQNLNEADRDDMVRYMKQAMVGTFFERWLKMGGWISSSSLKKTGDQPDQPDQPDESDDGGGKMPHRQEDSKIASATSPEKKEAERETKRSSSLKQPPKETNDHPHTSSTQSYAVASAASSAAATAANSSDEDAIEKYTSAAELEKLIRAIGTNPHLDSKQKNLTIQGLRDSVWKSNCRLSKRKREEGRDAMTSDQPATQVARLPPDSTAASAASAQVLSGGHHSQSHHMSFSVASGVATRFKRETPPSSYFKKMRDGEVKLVWSSDPHSTQFHPNDGSVPLFSASELAPTYHDGGINHVLGCPHYARSCKLRHPTSGRLYACRLCCEQTREMATKDKDSPLDRYEVKEILCMKCGALQPAGDKCVNPDAYRQGNLLQGTLAGSAISMMTHRTNLSTIVRSAMYVDQGKAWALIIATACVATHVSH
eukprot:CAMPEP_0183721426 /NCGR_PEP_ID=MMETSP0737-20130205/13706_1 /TAXON_ID=385413 /ORGANISM="Thalassiosira miniscula, Strain CCMP1093" /LENGTH=717 /DNA_ID=CAMNT_0025951433 /DNA_START=38 /DNA_END=2192 /DNA_ORIENTATION=+